MSLRRDEHDDDMSHLAGAPGGAYSGDGMDDEALPPPRVRPAQRPEDALVSHDAVVFEEELEDDGEPYDDFDAYDAPRAEPAGACDGAPGDHLGLPEGGFPEDSSAALPAAVDPLLAQRRAHSRAMGLRQSCADDRRRSSGRLPPVSPHGREPHPRAIAGPPKREGGSRRRIKVDSSQVGPAAGSEHALDALFGDEPIIVVEEMPPADLFGEDGRSSLTRTMRLRVDTALVGTILGLIMLSVAFMWGRSSAGPEGSVVATADPAPGRPPAAVLQHGGLPAASIAGQGLRPPSGRSGSSSAAVPRAPERRPAAAPVEGEAQRSAERAAARPAVEEPRFQIMAMRAHPNRAEEVKRFLEQNGLEVYLQRVSSRATNVRVGGYASISSARARADLERVRRLSFERASLSDAYFVPWKAGL